MYPHPQHQHKKIAVLTGTLKLCTLSPLPTIPQASEAYNHINYIKSSTF